MGGDEWWQTGPYQRDPAAAFRQAQAEELAKDSHGFEGRTIQELWEDKGWIEYILTGGTGTVLDQAHMVAATHAEDPTHDEWGPFMRPLTEEEIRAWCSSGRPTYAEWHDALTSDRLPFPGRACGNCTVLYRDGQPAQIGYWGTTAD
ncbi:hypothetical protein J7E88_21245 [Streptomyces sp. ISL-10]|uniref:hypothetical protein n=1 Tax=Streptomyces sp. ISL-10 TaxID=2819172 RepID=UPI001BE7B4BF|nr:hypothetical protein [Streptomyces sp. ISL-10]MBT2367764.1 hypothetical protein [Streptomyces sp. ISL-10]